MHPRRAGGFLVGRQQELTQLRGALDQAAAGVGGLVLVAGEPGIGKTSLVGELAAEARADGSRVLWGRCPEGGGSPPYWPWTQVLGERGRSPPDVGDDLMDLLTSPDAPAAGPVIDADDGRHRLRLFDRVVSRLRTLAAEQPALVIIEDIHAADPASLLLLSHVAADLPAFGVLAVATRRDPPGLPVDAPVEVGRRARWLTLDGSTKPTSGHWSWRWSMPRSRRACSGRSIEPPVATRTSPTRWPGCWWAAARSPTRERSPSPVSCARRSGSGWPRCPTRRSGSCRSAP